MLPSLHTPPSPLIAINSTPSNTWILLIATEVPGCVQAASERHPYSRYLLPRSDLNSRGPRAGRFSPRSTKSSRCRCLCPDSWHSPNPRAPVLQETSHKRLVNPSDEGANGIAEGWCLQENQKARSPSPQCFFPGERYRACFYAKEAFHIAQGGCHSAPKTTSFGSNCSCGFNPPSKKDALLFLSTRRNLRVSALATWPL